MSLVGRVLALDAGQRPGLAQGNLRGVGVESYKTRWPATLQGLCDEVLGCSDRMVRKWRALNPALDKLVAQEQIAPLMLHRGDVLIGVFVAVGAADPGFVSAQ